MSDDKEWGGGGDG